MSKMKSVAISCLVAMGTMASASAFAASYTVGGLPNGTSILTGATNATVAGNSLPCTAKFTVVVTAGVAKVTAASFDNSAACRAITTNLSSTVTWPIVAPTSATGPNNVKINGIVVNIPALGASCPGSITGTLNAAGRFAFNGALGFCTVQTTVAPGLVSSPVLLAVFP